MSTKKSSIAELARTNNISVQLLRKYIASGMSTDDAIQSCIYARDAHLAADSPLHKSSRGHGPVTWRGHTYVTFAAACRSQNLQLSTAYMQRNALLKKGYTIADASIAVLDTAAANDSKCRRGAKVKINGTEYDSQTAAAQALHISMSTINSCRRREGLNFEDAVCRIINRANRNITYHPCQLAPWGDLYVALCKSLGISYDAENRGIIAWHMPITASVDLPVSIYMSSPVFMTLDFGPLPIKAEQDINIINKTYVGIKLLATDDGIHCHCDISITHAILSDVRLFLRYWDHCLSVFTDFLVN